MMTTIHTDYKHSLATSGDEEDNERSGDTLVGSSIRSQDIRKDAASAVTNDKEKEKPRSSRKRRAPSLSGLTSSSAASSTFQSIQRCPLPSSSSSFLMPAATMPPQSLSPVPASPSSPFGQQQEQHRSQCYSHLGSLPAPPIPDLLADFFQHYPPRNKNSARTRNALAATSASAATRVRMEESKTPDNDITTTYIYNDHENDAYDYATKEEELFSAMAEERRPPSSHELEMIHASILANDDRLNREIDELFGAFGEEDIY